MRDNSQLLVGAGNLVVDGFLSDVVFRHDSPLNR
jgi:hypothetical protein